MRIADSLEKEKVFDFIFKLDMATFHIITGPLHFIDAVTGWDLVPNLKHAVTRVPNMLSDFFKAIEQVSKSIKGIVKGDKQVKLLKTVDVLKHSIPTA